MNTLDAVKLINAKREVHTPFKLVVQKFGYGQVELTFLSILRLLPSKRIVALAEYEGEQVLVKTYLGRTHSADLSTVRPAMTASDLATDPWPNTTPRTDCCSLTPKWSRI